MHYNANIPVPSQNGTGLMNQGGGIVPPALLEECRVPRFYQDAIASCGAVSASQLPNTALVYNLMVTSRLPRPVLGNIWSLVNRTLPGQLTRQEFFSCLALIALAQRGQSLIALSNVSLLPIPHLQACAPTPQQQPGSDTEPRGHDVLVLCPSTAPATTRTLPVQHPLRPCNSSLNTTPSLSHPPLTIRPSNTCVDVSSSSSSSSLSITASVQPPSTTVPQRTVNVSGPCATPSPMINFANFDKYTWNGASDHREKREMARKAPSSNTVIPQTPTPTPSTMNHQNNNAVHQNVTLQSNPLHQDGILLPESLATVTQQHTASENNQEVKDMYAIMRTVACSDNTQQGGECVEVWERCVQEAYNMMKQADTMLLSYPRETIRAVATTERGSHYISALNAIRKMVQRIENGRREQLKKMSKELNEMREVWSRLEEFMEREEEQVEECLNGTVPHRCGVCMTDIGSRDLLQFAGRAYHRQCANLWINRVDSLLP